MFAIRVARSAAAAATAVRSAACTAAVRPVVCIAPSCSSRGFAVTTAYERRSNTQELLDFETARKDINKWKKQLMYRSKQRGWLELDLIMGTWAEENLDKLDQTNLEHYAHIVASENPDLLKYFVEKVPMPAPLADNPIAIELVEYSQIQKKKWTVESGNQ